MSNLIRINEFSRKFEEPKRSEKLNKYVSSSFNKEIGFRTAQVPPEIEQGITQDQLRINDNYPFALGEKALIAREMGQYSILAVAINGSDDGNRPLIAYRYFWLTNIDAPDFDGVGTLLKWWEEKGLPFCDIKPHADYEKELSEHGEDYYQATPIDQKYSEQFQQQTKAYKNQTKKDLDPNQVGEKPYIFPIHKKGDTILPSYWGLHALALQLNNKYNNAPIAWSWNTSVMHKPIHFSLICCADENNYNLQVKWDKSSERLVIRPNSDRSNVRQTGSSSQNSTLEVSSGSIPYNQLKEELIKIAQKNQQLKYDHIPRLLENLKRGDSQTWDYQQLIDGNSYSFKLDKDKNQQLYFKIIILLLNPKGVTKTTNSNIININISDFITRIIPQQTQSQQDIRWGGRMPMQRGKMTAQRNLEPVIPQTRVAVATMQRFLFHCEQNLPEESYQRLTRNLYDIINQLFLEIISSPLQDKYYQAIQGLLVQNYDERDDFSAYHFQTYLRGYENQLIDWLNTYYKYKTNRDFEPLQNNNKIDQFCQQVIRDLIGYEQKQNQITSTRSLEAEKDELTGLSPNQLLNSEVGMINQTGTTQTQPSQELSKYKRIANIFYNARCYNLAAFFSQLSLGYVPPEIYKQCSDPYQIIPLKKNPEVDGEIEDNNPDPDPPPLPPDPWWTMILLGLLILGVGAAGGFLIGRFFLSSNPTPDSSVSSSITFDPSRTFEQRVDDYRNPSNLRISEEVKNQLQSSLLQDMTQLNETMKQYNKVTAFPTNKDTSQAKALQGNFIQKRQTDLGNLVAYSYVESLTPEIEQTLSQETLTTMKVDKVLAENTQGDETSNKVSALMQPILKSLGFYKVDLTNTWDQPTSAAIKGFQGNYKLPATGNLDQATWDILYIMIKDKQVTETAIVLKLILESSQNPTELEQKMTELEQCTNAPVTYFNCLNQLKPQTNQ